MLAELYRAWEGLADTTHPPAEAILLHQDESVTVYVDSDWGPPVPYSSASREDGGMNHGYVRLKGNPEAIVLVPEVDGWPEYRQFLERLNTETSPIETVGCEKSFFPCELGEAKVKLGSYTDIIFTDAHLNDEPRYFLRLADALAQAMHGSREWWSIAEIARAKTIKSSTLTFESKYSAGDFGGVTYNSTAFPLLTKRDGDRKRRAQKPVPFKHSAKHQAALR